MDKRIREILDKEKNRQRDNIELIASENYVSNDILELQGSIFTNKYAEGYPGKRYYGGCENVDDIENLAIEYVCKLFNVKYANVQPHSGSQANMAVYRALLNHGDKIMGLNLSHGGHLTHGHKLNFSGIDYEVVSYNVDNDSEVIDYDKVREIALKEKPKMIIAGASAYSREIDFKKFKDIALEVGAYLMVDMAHIAGLVAAGLHPSPVPYCDFVTTTTHKTLRGPRGGIIMCKEQYAKALDRALFPGSQGGPLMHVIAGKAQCFYEALDPSFKEYAKQIILNIKALAKTLEDGGIRLVSGGSDNHLLLCDLTNIGVTGKEAEVLLDKVCITCNKNAIPNDPLKPAVTSGIRLGSAAMTTRGFKEVEFIKTGELILKVLKNKDNEVVLNEVRKEVIELTDRFPYQPY